MTRRIPLTRGYVALVDDEDYEWLSKFSWCALVLPRTVYATRRRRNHEVSGRKRQYTTMHRQILAAKSGESVDHVNHDGLDNRRANLRICTISQNGANQRKTRGSSQFKGVCWDISKGNWMARLKTQGKDHYLGRFSDEVEAARAYDRAALETWGEFAHLNFPS